MNEAQHPTVHQAWSKVMAAVQAIGKNERNTDQGFNFRGIDATINAVGPELRAQQVIVVPYASEIVADERYTTKKGTAMRGVTVRVNFRVFGPGGDHFQGQALGEAADSGDKAISKAHSVAYRTFLLQSLCIPTNEPDPDSESHERSDEKSTREKAEEFAMAAGMDFWDVFGSLELVLAGDRDSLTVDQARAVCEEISRRKKARA
jgi:hypothetical protein